MKMNHDILKRLHQDVYRGSQSWCYKAVWEYGEERLKVDIKRDAYDCQSHARAYVWSRSKQEWSPISDIHISQSEFKSISYVSDNVTAANFERDEEALLDRALTVIGVHTSPTRPDALHKNQDQAPATHASDLWDCDGRTIMYAAPHESDAVEMIQVRANVTEDGWDTIAFIEAIWPRAENNARRIVAARNACQGLSTAELERGIVRDLIELANQVVLAKDDDESVPVRIYNAAMRLQHRCKS